MEHPARRPLAVAPLRPAGALFRAAAAPLRPATAQLRPAAPPFRPATAPRRSAAAPLRPATAPLRPVTAPLATATAPRRSAAPPLRPATAPWRSAAAPFRPATALLPPATAPLPLATVPLSLAAAPLPTAAALLPPATVPLPPATAPRRSAAAPLPPATAPLSPAATPLPPATAPLPPATAPLPPADEKLVLKFIEIFPDAFPHYIRTICAGKIWSEVAFSEVLEMILAAKSYPRRPERPPSPKKQLDLEEQLNIAKMVLPDACPSFLNTKIDQLAGDEKAFQEFIEDAVENGDYPTRKDYLRQQQLSAQQRQYTTEFQVERFVELFPDPVAVFEDCNKKTTIRTHADISCVQTFMKIKYVKLYAQEVNSIVKSTADNNTFAIVKELDKYLATGRVKRYKSLCRTKDLRVACQNIPLLQELAYFEHKGQILEYLESKQKQLAEERQNTKQLGLLQTCTCCFDEEVMPCDILTCTGGCRFCRECIKRSVEVAFSEGKTNFPCFSNECDAEFCLQVLQNILPPKMFSKLAQKKAIAEVKAAGMEDLEMCPFCDFASIPPPEDKLFRCFNPECMKESCRRCKQPSHVPLNCEDIIEDEDVKARIYIENKMAEALIRECWKCGAKFIKEEGCNKMTCSCGAMMCYICRQPVKNYNHFNGQGGDRFDLCPLYTDNFSVNEKNVLQAAEQAKKDIDLTKLKNDPTVNLEKYFMDKNKADVGKV